MPVALVMPIPELDVDQVLYNPEKPWIFTRQTASAYQLIPSVS
jgi:hypothetical protein